MNEPLLDFKIFLKIREVEIKEKVPFAELSFIKLGGICNLLVYPSSVRELIDIIKKAKELKIRYKILGRMSNILPPDGACNTVIIKTDRMKRISEGDGLVYAECGVSLPSLAAYFRRRGFSAFEELSGIPASIGGAVYMNAGAYGKEIADIIAAVSAYDIEKNEIKDLRREELEFSYRHSPFSEGKLCILSAAFKYVSKAPEEIGTEMSLFADKRRAAQPIDLPSLGSTFKRSGNVSAALLIDRSGLKGTRIGGVKVSEKHAGFIVNAGGGLSSDYRALCELIKRIVFEKHGVTLQEEIEYLE